MFLVLVACRGAEPAPAPTPPRTRADAHEARLRAALQQPGVWSGATGTLEVTPQGRLKLALRACQYPDLDPTRADGSQPLGCMPQDGERALLGIEGPYVVLQETDPRMPLYAPAWLDAAGVLHLGAFQSNRMWAAAADDAGHARYPFTPGHYLTVDPGPACTWEDQLAQWKGPIPCTAVEDGPVTRIRFEVPPGGRGPWEGAHGAVWIPADGVMVDPEIEVVTFTRSP